MTILPKIRTRYGENVGIEIFTTPPHLADNNMTFIVTDASSGVSSFTVDNGLKFSTGQFVSIGPIGAEKSEIIRVHTVTTPTATVLTLNSATSFAHNRGERIAFIPYDQIIIERSTDGGSTYSTLTTLNIRADSTETYYNDTGGLSTYYYRAKFSNSASAAVSQASDGIIGTGFVESSAGYIIRSALVTLGEQIDEVITKEFLYFALTEGRNELDKMPGVERWSFRTAFDYNAGSVIPGQYKLTLPTNMRESDTFKNLLGVRIGRNKFDINKVDKRALDRWFQGVARSTLNGSITSGSTSIVLTASGDFDDSGAVYIAAEAVSEVLDVVDYTGNTLATNTLTGVTNIRSTGHSSGVLVWQGSSFGYPTEYTVNGGEIIFSQPFGDDFAGEVIYLDYYKKITAIDSDGDLLDEPNPSMYIDYLRYRIKKRRDKTLVKDQDDDYKSWVDKRNAAVQKEYLGQDVRLVIDVPR